MNLKGRTVLITGASDGFGKEIAIAAADEGASIALVARRETQLKEVSEVILSSGGNSECFVCDVCEENQVKECVSKVYEKFGSIDVLINAAGIWFEGSTESHPPEKVKELFMINSIGPIFTVQSVLPIMKKQNEGIILNVVSDSGLHASGNWGVYCASKFAAKGFTDSLRMELVGTKIKVLGFYQGGMNTNFFKKAGFSEPNQPWMMDPNELAKIVVFMLTRPDDIDMRELEVTKNK